MPTTVQDLPVELVEWIAEYLPPRELLSMRLVSKDIAGKTLKPVTDRFFRDRAFFFRCEASMRTLARIAVHPVFSKTFKTMRLSWATLPDFDEDLRRRIVTMPEQTRAARRERRERRSRYETMRKNQDRFKDLLFNFLTRVLVTFKAAGNIPAIHAASAYTRGSPVPCVSRWYGRLLGYEPCWEETSEPDPLIYKTILCAIMKANYPIHTLVLGYARNPVPFSVFKNCQHHPAFKDLHSLHLTLLPDHRKRDEHGRSLMVSSEYSDSMVSFLAFLVATKELRDLALNYESPLAFTPDRCIFNCLAVHSDNANVLPRLRNLCLRGFMVDAASFLRFLNFRKNSFREVHLSNVKDNAKTHIDMEKRIAAALNDGSTVKKKICLHQAWDGWKWMENYLGMEITEEFISEVFGLDTGTDTYLS